MYPAASFIVSVLMILEVVLGSHIGWQLAIAARTWRSVVDLWMADMGLTQSRWMALLHLQRLGEGCSQSELAQHMGIEQPSLQRTMNRLVEDGIVERRNCDVDARRRTLWFTAEGHVLLQKVQARIEEGRSRILAGLSAEQLELLSGMLETLILNARQLQLEPPHDT